MMNLYGYLDYSDFTATSLEWWRLIGSFRVTIPPKKRFLKWIGNYYIQIYPDFFFEVIHYSYIYIYIISYIHTCMLNARCVVETQKAGAKNHMYMICVYLFFLIHGHHYSFLSLLLVATIIIIITIMTSVITVCFFVFCYLLCHVYCHILQSSSLENSSDCILIH